MTPIPRFSKIMPTGAPRGLPAVLGGSIALVVALILAACGTPMNRAPVVNRDINVGLAPIIQGRTAANAGSVSQPGPDSVGAATPSGYGVGQQSGPPAVASRDPGAIGNGLDQSENGSTVVESAAIQTGRIDARPIAGDAAAGTLPPARATGAPIITMTSEPDRPAPVDGGVALPPVAAQAAPNVAASGATDMAGRPAAGPQDLPSAQADTGSRVAMAPPSVADQAPSVAAAAPPAAAAGRSESSFIWPANGAVTKSFTDPKSMGIAIAGKAGDPVSAIADGRVIFSGLGPRGYGKLLIIKHDDDLLSVYANNSSLLAKEGQTVRQGERIAELGSSGTDAPRLHFEIRRLGKPVDPISYLPQKLQ